jgi:hypothetical protein
VNAQLLTYPSGLKACHKGWWCVERALAWAHLRELLLENEDYRRAQDEGRTLLQAALSSTADLKVSKRELRVRLASQSSPHRTRAIATLCEELNKEKAIFPGSNLRLVYAIQEPS